MASSEPAPPSAPGVSPTEVNAIHLDDNAQAKQVAAGHDITQTYIEQQTVYEIERATDVRGLPNPYLGLASFTYADRAKYAGREKLIAETVTKMTLPVAPAPLVFVTGASGSGKSSFAQAGLVPALETHYAALTVKHAVLRPGHEPAAALADALWRQLGMPLRDATNLTAESIGDFLRTNTPDSQINLIVIDQFDEFFTLTAASQRDVVFQVLAQLPSFSVTHTHVIATLRADYLPELFAHAALFNLAKQGVDVRVMTVEELIVAIRQPLHAAYPEDAAPGGRKALDPELVERLAQDASKDAAYLPLLQVTLQEIWRKGSLTLGAYANLAAAIEERADQVLRFRDYDAATPTQPRSTDEQAAMLDLLLDLVDVSLDDNAGRDVRRPRSKIDLAQGSPERSQWIDELVRARLLSTEIHTASGASAITPDDASVEVELIHESLLTHWDRLEQAISQRRQQLRQRARFELNLKEWLAQNRADAYLLQGVRLAEAQQLAQRQDIAMQSADANELLRASLIAASKELERQAERRQLRYLRQAFGGALGVALGYGLGFGYIFWTLHPNLPELAILLFLSIAPMGALLGFSIGLALWYWRDRPRAQLVGATVLSVSIGAVVYVLYLVVGTPPPVKFDVSQLVVGALLGGGLGLGAAVPHDRLARLVAMPLSGLVVAAASAILTGALSGNVLTAALAGIAIGGLGGLGFYLTAVSMEAEPGT